MGFHLFKFILMKKPSPYLNVIVSRFFSLHQVPSHEETFQSMCSNHLDQPEMQIFLNLPLMIYSFPPIKSYMKPS